MMAASILPPRLNGSMADVMDENAISNWLTENFDHVKPKDTWGETSFFVNPGDQLPSGSYFATLKSKNGDNDKASDLDREGVFRLNFGAGRSVYKNRFGKPPARPTKGGIIDGPWSFDAWHSQAP